MYVYFATTLASVAILTHRSQLEKGTPFDIPDYRPSKEAVEKLRSALAWYFSPENPDYLPTPEELKAYTMPIDNYTKE